MRLKSHSYRGRKETRRVLCNVSHWNRRFKQERVVNSVQHWHQVQNNKEPITHPLDFGGQGGHSSLGEAVSVEWWALKPDWVKK